MTEQSPGPCPRHPEKAAEFKCRHCGAPICKVCIENLGEFCSSACMDAETRPPDDGSDDDKVWKQAGDKMGGQLALVQKVATIAGGVLLLVALLVGAWVAWTQWLHPWGRTVWIVRGGGAKAPANRVVRATPGEVVAVLGTDILTVRPEDGAIAWRARSTQAYWPLVRQLDGAYELRHGQALARISTDGKALWASAFPTPRKLLAEGDSMALFVAGHWIGYNEWAEQEKAADRDVPDLEGYTIGPLKKPPVWIEDELVAVSLTTGKDLWRQPMKRGVGFIGVDIGGGVCVGVVRSVQETWKQRRLVASKTALQMVALDAATGKLRWYQAIEQPPAWGPRVEDNQIVYCDFGFTHYLDLDGKPRRQEEGRRPSAVAADEDAVPLVPPTSAGGPGEDAACEAMPFPDTLALPGGIGPGMEGGIACTDPETGQERWSFNLKGGVVLAGANSSQVFVVGHLTELGGQSAVIAQGSKMIGLEGIGVAGLGVADWVLVALDRATGKEQWRREDVAGTIVASDDRLVVLQDTRLTSVRVAAGDLAGELVLHQFNPRTGRRLWSRTRGDLALHDARILGRRLVAVAYDREPRPGNPERRGNCQGLVGIRLR